MKIPTFVTKEAVREACTELGISDWTQLTEARIEPAEAAVVRTAVGGEALEVTVSEFRRGLEVELEHGLQFSDANVTNNHPLLTGMIVLAHLKEMLDYYTRLEVAELEGDLLKAYAAGDKEKMASKYGKLLEAKLHLVQGENSQRAG